jgi:hypothetical protein
LAYLSHTDNISIIRKRVDNTFRNIRRSKALEDTGVIYFRSVYFGFSDGSIEL